MAEGFEGNLGKCSESETDVKDREFRCGGQDLREFLEDLVELS